MGMQTQGMGFASFGERPSQDCLKPMAGFINLGHRVWCDYPRTVARFARLIKRFRPPAVVAFGVQPLIVASAALRVAGVNTGLGYVEITRPFTALQHSTRRVVALANSVLLRNALSRVQIAAANSRDGLAELERFMSSRETPMRLVRNPIDLRFWGCVPKRRRVNHEIRILTSGRLVPSKGIRDLIEAVARVSSLFEIAVVVAGDGPERGTLERHSAALGIGDRVRFLGWVTDLRSEMDQAELFVFPSHYEGYPNAVLEAMASSTPVVSSFWGTDAHALHAAGVIRGYPCGDVDALSATLIEVIRSRDLQGSLAERGRLCVRDYAVENVVEDYQSIFHELMRMVA